MKKTLSIILAALMLVSCIPMFASAAAINIKSTNMIIVPPELTAYEIEYGEDLYTVISAVGGELYYNNGRTITKVEGTFSIPASEHGPSKPTKEYSPKFKFTPADSSQFRVSSILQNTIAYQRALKEGYSWPTVHVKGKTATIVEAPIVPDIPINGLVSSYGGELTGGKVIDEDGNDITANGTWSYAETSVNYDKDTDIAIEFDCEGFYTASTVAPIKVTVEPATMVGELTAQKLVDGKNIAYATLSGGTVVDAEGNDITGAYWHYNTTNKYPSESGYFDVEWDRPGYSPLTSKVYVEVECKKTELVEIPTVIATTGASSKAVFLGGKVIDENGNDITAQGKFSINPSTTLYESGEKTVIWQLTGYATQFFTVYVDVSKEIGNPVSITEYPTVETFNYEEGLTVKDIVLVGGTASTEGTFSPTDPEQLIIPGINTVNFTFIPTDENYAIKRFNITFLVKDYIKVLVLPEYNVDYGKSLSDLNGSIKAYGGEANVENVSVSFNIEENADIYNTVLVPGEYSFKAQAYAAKENVSGLGNVQKYIPEIIEVKVNVSKKTVTEPFGRVSPRSAEADGITYISTYYRFTALDGANGHCVLKINGETVLDNIVPTATYFEYEVTQSGTYNVTLEYIPADDDYVIYDTTVLSADVEITVESEEDNSILPDIEGTENSICDFLMRVINWFKNLFETIKNFFVSLF